MVVLVWEARNRERERNQHDTTIPILRTIAFKCSSTPSKVSRKRSVSVDSVETAMCNAVCCPTARGASRECESAQRGTNGPVTYTIARTGDPRISAEREQVADHVHIALVGVAHSAEQRRPEKRVDVRDLRTQVKALNEQLQHAPSAVQRRKVQQRQRRRLLESGNA